MKGLLAESMVLKAIVIALVSFLIPGISNGQITTNSGTDFWFAFTETIDQAAAGYQVNVSGSVPTTGVVEIPGTGFFQAFAVTPGIVTQILLPPNDAHIDIPEVIDNRGIHVTSNDDIVVYASTFHAFRSEASLVLPTSALGSAYRVMSYSSETKNGTLWASEFLIAAAADTVVVEINPSANTSGGQTTGIPWMVTLAPGEIYMVQADSVVDDLTGTTIIATNPTDKFAVFGGNQWSTIFCSSTSDPIFEALFPINTWGKDYIMVPTPTVDFEVFRVMAEFDNTDILINNNFVITLNAGQFYEDTLSQGSLISGSRPISVGAFMITSNLSCSGNTQGDPSMIMLNPNEQMFLDTITFYTVDTINIASSYVTVATRTQDTSTLLLNGAPLTNFTVLAADPNYSFTSDTLLAGSHTLTTTGCGFLAYARGIGNLESYGYAAGVSLSQLDDSVAFVNISTGSDTICIGDSIQFLGSTVGNPVSVTWLFDDGNSSNLLNPIHVYTAGGTYNFQLAITYPCQIDTLFGSLEIIAAPTIDLGEDTTFCLVTSHTLNAGNPGFNFLWTPGGQTTQTITVVDSGLYSVTITNQICIASDTIVVDFPVFNTSMSIDNLSSDSSGVCAGELLEFTGFADFPAVGITWDFSDNTGGTNLTETHSYPAGGVYDILFEAQYLCNGETLSSFQTDSIVVTTQPIVDLGNDTFLCVYTPFPLDAGPTATNYDWSNGESGRVMVPKFIGIYGVVASNGRCVDSDTIQIQEAEQFFLPNVITPNNDGKNDLFEIRGADFCLQFRELHIFNRWGEVIYKTEHPLSLDWDGRNGSGQLMPEGTYFFTLSGDSESHHGSLTLIH